MVITGKKEIKEEVKADKKEELAPTREGAPLQDSEIPGGDPAGCGEGHAEERHSRSGPAEGRACEKGEDRSATAVASGFCSSVGPRGVRSSGDAPRAFSRNVQVIDLA